MNEQIKSKRNVMTKLSNYIHTVPVLFLGTPASSQELSDERLSALISDLEVRFPNMGCKTKPIATITIFNIYIYICVSYICVVYMPIITTSRIKLDLGSFWSLSASGLAESAWLN